MLRERKSVHISHINPLILGRSYDDCKSRNNQPNLAKVGVYITFANATWI